MKMSQTSQEKNKALVLEAFETLFNKRDYVAAERFWSPNYIQHSAHIAPGHEGMFNLIKGIPPTLQCSETSFRSERGLTSRRHPKITASSTAENSHSFNSSNGELKQSCHYSSPYSGATPPRNLTPPKS
jgi:hypothetical protein